METGNKLAVPLPFLRFRRLQSAMQLPVAKWFLQNFLGFSVPYLESVQFQEVKKGHLMNH